MNTNTLIENKMMTVDQVAEKLQVPVSWVYDRTRKRKASKNPIPAHNVGKHLRFYEHEIEEWLLFQGSSLKFRDIKNVSHKKG